MATNIVLADAQATPVNHTFQPAGFDAKGVFTFVDRSSDNAVGNWLIRVDVRQPVGAASGTYRYKIELHEPVLEVLGDANAAGYKAAPSVAYTPRVFVEFVLPDRTAVLDRKNIRKMAAGLLNDSQIASIVENLTNVI
ncbi:MAG: hypothetical protein [Sanya fiers-like virus 54]|nr:MAG: hypothetical protein [Sanya fiers-like virus 54]